MSRRSAPLSRRPAPRAWPWTLILTLAVLAGGGRAAHVSLGSVRGMGFDEALYRNYLRELIRAGWASYPDIVDGYLAFQKTIPGSILPPTRSSISCVPTAGTGCFGTEPLACFYAVSRVFGVGTLLVAGGFARRLFADRRLALATVALMAFSPLQSIWRSTPWWTDSSSSGRCGRSGRCGKTCNDRGIAPGWRGTQRELR